MRTEWLPIPTTLLLCAAIACAGSEPSPEDAEPPATAAPAGSELPAGHPPLPAAPDAMAQVVPPPPGSGTGATAMTWQAPAAWIAEPPRNVMRQAQYRVPGPDGEGECVVYYFGPGQGGDAQANAERWAGQFTQPGGGDSREALRTESIRVGDIPVLLVEVGGTYSGGMPGVTGPGEALEDHLLLGAVAEGPDANWFFKFSGPRKTVEANRAAFDAMIRSLGRGA